MKTNFLILVISVFWIHDGLAQIHDDPISNQDIYDFINEIKDDLEIPDTAYLKPEPKQIIGENSIYIYDLKDFMLVSKKDSISTNSNEVLVVGSGNPRRVFTAQDTLGFYKQDEMLFKGLIWDSEALGFKKEGDLEISFSMPYFSVDRKKVLLVFQMADKSVLIHGSMQSLLYKKFEEGWKKRVLRSFIF